ncbi:ER membrane protein complex subunit 6 [Pieris brassicae]|uniref:ER membrane protein complex subunit 6 n=1 Tax=Pieris brassicae TaxID=7116 RepID=A0A9P0TT77_PIEBR|nr:ER membrane protein complex subunit 6 [Pieris brassicae]XP_045532640.1 ER membrane protein complex subunit 6 [Pieris brassicae]CAH4037023.1 unnamed protein product [Pieris brassicae]
MSVSLKANDNKPEPIAYSEAALRNNAIVVEYCRTSMSALSGSTAGVLGLTSLNGFAFYMFAVIILWVMFMIKAGPNWPKYYVSRQSILTNGFFGGLFTYVLFWTFIYGMVHVY